MGCVKKFLLIVLDFTQLVRQLVPTLVRFFVQTKRKKGVTFFFLFFAGDAGDSIVFLFALHWSKRCY